MIRPDGNPLYLDYAASTPLAPEVLEAMLRILSTPALAANPSATTHEPGRAAQREVEAARGQVAGLIGADPGEMVFTSGATEADNLAILGAASFRAARGRHLITALTEHTAVIASCRHLESRGWRITWLRPDGDGIIFPAQVEAALQPDTVLVSIMQANNETGVVQDVGAIGALCRRHDLLFHVDAAQGAGRLPLPVRDLQIDLLSLSAHKLYGPKGVGALFIDGERVRRVAPLLFGGGQERGLRPGTVPTHQVVGMGAAFALAAARLPERNAHVLQLRDRLWARLSGIPGVLRNGCLRRNTGHILNVSVTEVEGESLFLALGSLAVSGGAACTSLTDEPSQVLQAMGRSRELARSSVRFSFGEPTTIAAIDQAAAHFEAAVSHLRQLAPAAMGP